MGPCVHFFVRLNVTRTSSHHTDIMIVIDRRDVMAFISAETWDLGTFLDCHYDGRVAVYMRV
jgi:hypothetical protein